MKYRYWFYIVAFIGDSWDEMPILQKYRFYIGDIATTFLSNVGKYEHPYNPLWIDFDILFFVWGS